jgi:hypothetical protein
LLYKIIDLAYLLPESELYLKNTYPVPYIFIAMTRKICLLTIALIMIPSFLLVFLNGCCGKGEFYCIYLKSLSITAIDNADSVERAPVNNEVIARAMILRVAIGDSTAICRNNSYPGLGNMAYARSCRTSEYRAVSGIRQYSLFSDHDFDALHPAGTDLFDIFYLSNKSDIATGGVFNYYCREAPADTGTHTFTVILALSNGTRLIAHTQPLKLLK